MKLFSSERSLGLASSGQIEVFSSSMPPVSEKPQIFWPQELPSAKALPGILSCRQIWASGAMHTRLESLGIPAQRLFKVDSLEEGMAFSELIEDSGPDLVWRGPWGRNSSLASVNSMLCWALEKKGMNILLQAPGQAPASFAVPSVSQSWPLDFIPPSQGPMITYAPWEYYFVPQEWQKQGALLSNRWWTPSLYCKEGMQASGMPEEWIDVIPNGVDLQHFSPSGEKFPLPGYEDHMVFLFVGGTIFRKGIDILRQAWQKAFLPHEKVLLLIKDFGADSHYLGHNSLAQLQEWAQEEDHAPVMVLSQMIEAELMPSLYRASSVGVFPYRGEGFCMPALESMSCGRPIIFPSQGPSSEYCSEGGWALEATPRLLEAPPRGMPLAGLPLVHEVKADDLAHTMRQALDLDLSQKGFAARKEAEAFSWDHAADLALLAIERIKDEQPTHLLRALKPEGKAFIMACRPCFGSKQWQKPFVQAVMTADKFEDFSLVVFGDQMEEQQTIDLLLAALNEEGVDPESLSLDLSVACQGSWPSLALGCQAILLLGQEDDFICGRQKVLLEDLDSFWETNKGSQQEEMAS